MVHLVEASFVRSNNADSFNEASHSERTENAPTERQNPVRLCYGQWEVARPQPTSTGTNYSACNPSAHFGEIQPLRTKALCDCGAVAIALLKGCPNYCFDLST